MEDRVNDLTTQLQDAIQRLDGTEANLNAATAAANLQQQNIDTLTQLVQQVQQLQIQQQAAAPLQQQPAAPQQQQPPQPPPDAAAERLRIENLKILRTQVGSCDGSDSPKLRRWLRDIDRIATRDGDQMAKDVVFAAAAGALADAIEAYYTAQAALVQPVVRNQVRWENIKIHIKPLFLGPQHQRSLQVALRKVTQRTNETLGAYIHRFTDEADDAYPHPRGETENHLVADLFVAGLTSDTLKLKLRTDHVFNDLGACVEQARRLEPLLQEAAATAAVAPQSQKPVPGDPIATLQKQVHKLYTKVDQVCSATKHQNPSDTQCYECGKSNHFKRDCPVRKERIEREQQQQRDQQRYQYNQSGRGQPPRGRGYGRGMSINPVRPQLPPRGRGQPMRTADSTPRRPGNAQPGSWQ